MHIREVRLAPVRPGILGQPPSGGRGGGADLRERTAAGVVGAQCPGVVAAGASEADRETPRALTERFGTQRLENERFRHVVAVRRERERGSFAASVGGELGERAPAIEHPVRAGVREVFAPLVHGQGVERLGEALSNR